MTHAHPVSLGHLLLLRVRLPWATWQTASRPAPSPPWPLVSGSPQPLSQPCRRQDPAKLLAVAGASLRPQRRSTRRAEHPHSLPATILLCRRPSPPCRPRCPPPELRHPGPCFHCRPPTPRTLPLRPCRQPTRLWPRCLRLSTSTVGMHPAARERHPAMHPIRSQRQAKTIHSTPSSRR